MKCWKCQTELELPLPLSFRALCEECHAWQHCCVNCKHYAPGRPNNCAIPETDPISDRENANFCDFFSLKNPESKKTLSSQEVAEKLFGESSLEQNPKKSWEDLFNE